MRVARMKSCGRCAPPEEFTSLTCSAVSPGINQGLVRSLKFFFSDLSPIIAFPCHSITHIRAYHIKCGVDLLDSLKLFHGFL